MKSPKRHIAYGTGILLLIISLHLFVFEICLVPSPSMEPAIMTNEIVVYNKLSYGAIFPHRWADIPIVNAFTWIVPLRKADEGNNWGHHRLGGYTRPKVNDVIVFHALDDNQKLVVKRVKDIYPKGTTLRITQQDKDSILKIVRRDNGNVVHRHDRLYINGHRTDSYTLRQDFFYVRGDNTAASFDSRNFGLIPEEAVVGKMGIVLYSWDSKVPWVRKPRWKRLFKTIN